MTEDNSAAEGQNTELRMGTVPVIVTNAELLQMHAMQMLTDKELAFILAGQQADDAAFVQSRIDAAKANPSEHPPTYRVNGILGSKPKHADAVREFTIRFKPEAHPKPPFDKEKCTWFVRHRRPSLKK